MTIRYSQLPEIKSKIILAPMVPVTFHYRKEEFSTIALVDSGAAGCVISTVIADELGIDWKKIKMNAGFSVGGTFRSHIVEGTTIEVLEHKFSSKISILEGIGPYKYILGQADIFQRAKITFEGYKKQFSLDFLFSLDLGSLKVLSRENTYRRVFLIQVCSISQQYSHL